MALAELKKKKKYNQAQAPTNNNKKNVVCCEVLGKKENLSNFCPSGVTSPVLGSHVGGRLWRRKEVWEGNLGSKESDRIIGREIWGLDRDIFCLFLRRR